MRMTEPKVVVTMVLALTGSGWADVPTTRQANPARHADKSAEDRALREAEEDYRSGVRAADGVGVPRDYATAARYYRKAAEKGHVPAQYNLAYLFENGLGVKRDCKQAAFWYRKAAEQGDAESQNNLGVLYATGQGVPRDDAEAARWYRLASDQGDLEGMSNLATMYLTGRGVERDVVKAFQLCRDAAEGGYAVAQNNLALMYANGEGVERDYVWAYAWVDLAAAEIPNAAELRDRIAKKLSPDEMARACNLAVEKRRQLAQRHGEPK
jgi:TPR repeat protein